MPRNTRIALIAAAGVVVIVAAIVVIAGGGSDNKSSSDAGKTVAIKVVNEKPVGGVKTINVNKGDQVKFTITADKGDEIHVHGYNFHKDIPKSGGTVAFAFPAKMDGIFDVELEGPGVQVASLKVNP